MRKISLLFVGLLLAGCQTGGGGPAATPASAPLVPPSAADEAKAKAAVKRTLKDPESAQFEGLFTHPGAVCGFVNAKNSYGGYTGRKPFGYIIAQDAAYVLEVGGRADVHALVTQYCVR